MRGTLEKTETREWVLLENNGQKIFGVLHKPLTVNNPPICVVMHGFASSKVGSNRCYVTLAERFAQIGIATLRFDFRGSGDSEGSLTDISFNDLVSDAIAVLQQLEHIEGIDFSRCALFGASLGGTLAILAASQMLSPHIKALALWAPVASGELWYRDFLNRFPDYRTADPKKILGSYKGVTLHPDFHGQFAQLFAYTNIQLLRDLPILHMHGEKDDMISIAHQEAFQQACIEHSTIRFIKYPDGGHALGTTQSFPQIINATIDWFERYL
jgi:fermentation-respiration switch protein FrsA (DUF1100 family)